LINLTPEFRKLIQQGRKIDNMKKNKSTVNEHSKEADKFPLPVYPANEDIYQKARETKLDEDNEEGFDKLKGKIRKEGDELDVPGSELDDKEETIGEEDEENNYYSLGGPDHDDLEETNSDDR
jgi:hypothetical protein